MLHERRPIVCGAARGVASAPDGNRAACHAVSEANDAGEYLNPEFTRPAATEGMKAKDPRLVAAAGQVLQATADVEAAKDPRGGSNIALAEAVVEMADACGDLYGEGPW